MIAMPVGCAAIGAALPFTALAGPLGFTALPVAFFLILLGLTGAYLALVEFAKAWFYATQRHPRRARPTHAERHAHHVQRRAARFIDRHAPMRRPSP